MSQNATVASVFVRLDRVIPEDPPRSERPEAAAHPMRAVTRQIAFEPGGWTAERRTKVAALFDGLAPEWHLHLDDPQRAVPLHDAYDRGGIRIGGTCLEIGSGDGANTSFLTERHDEVVALDLSHEMIRRGRGTRVMADAGDAPIRSGAIDIVVLVNAFLFPTEVDRLLAPNGVLVWANTAGENTPIHLPAEEVSAALPGSWDGLGAEAGWGTWSVWRRAGT